MIEPDAKLFKCHNCGHKWSTTTKYTECPYCGKYDSVNKPLFSAETIQEELKDASLELEGYCTDHDEWIWEEDHRCLELDRCDIWTPTDGHIWADFAKQVIKQKGDEKDE